MVLEGRITPNRSRRPRLAWAEQCKLRRAPRAPCTRLPSLTCNIDPPTLECLSENIQQATAYYSIRLTS